MKELIFQQFDYGNRFEFALIERIDGERYCAEPPRSVAIGDGHVPQPTFVLHRDELQALVNELHMQGIVPTALKQELTRLQELERQMKTVRSFLNAPERG